MTELTKETRAVADVGGSAAKARPDQLDHPQFRVVPAGRPFAAARRRPCRLLAWSCSCCAGFAPAALCGAVCAVCAIAVACKPDKSLNSPPQSTLANTPTPLGDSYPLISPLSIMPRLHQHQLTPTPTLAPFAPFAPLAPQPPDGLARRQSPDDENCMSPLLFFSRIFRG